VTSWSSQQEAALKAVSAWVRAGEPQVFRLFGYAGTGKTTLAKRIAEDVEGEVAFCAYTGKAALVLRQRGCPDATTIHAMIYRSKESGEAGAVPAFSLNRSGPAAKVDLIVVDECSMVDEELGRDLLSFGKQVLVLGDPAQLPPVKGGGFFTEGVAPDVMLTEVHRQAAGNPIVRLSMLVREGGKLTAGSYGESRVVRRDGIDAEAVTRADQVLVGRNRTRHLYNGRIRALRGFEGPTPVAGEKLVCLRNDRTKGLFNGGTWRVEEAKHWEKKAQVVMRLTPDDETGARTAKVSVRPEFFDGREDDLPYPLRRESDEFTYGYALTVHKAQGSQWGEVVLFDESWAFREHATRWLYTALTRAAERITVVL